MKTIFAITLSVCVVCCASSDSDEGGSESSGDNGETTAGTTAGSTDMGSEATTGDDGQNTGDPATTDSDNDGLTDAEEATLGTDSQNADTDGDTYSDYHEQLEGSDPLNKESRIYTGYWPYNPDKDSMETSPWTEDCPTGFGCDCNSHNQCSTGFCLDTPKGGFCGPSLGLPIPRFVGIDQFGDEVDIYDFAKQGKYIVLDMSTGWCKPCKQLANWFVTGNEAIKSVPSWLPEYDRIRDLVNSHQVLWITVLYEDANKGPANQEIITEWAEAYPHEGIPVLADVDKQLHLWLKPSGLPNLHILSQNMEMLTYNNRGITDAFDYIIAAFPEE